VIRHSMPLLYRRSQITHRPEPTLTEMQIDRSIRPHPFPELSSLFGRQLVGIRPLPMRPQGFEPVVSIVVRPLAHTALAAGHHVQNLAQAYPATVQPYRLQPLEFVDVSRPSFRLAKALDFPLTELKASFGHSMILHHVSSF
jgi:hypothetical protein